MPENKKGSCGFTLVEVVMATAVLGLVIGGAMTFFIHGLSTSHMTAGKLMVSHDMRKFTSEMTDEARNASRYEVFSSFTDRTPAPDGFSGDYLVLYYYDDAADASTIDRMVGYYRAPDENGEGPVRKHDSDVTGLDPDDSAALPSPAEIETYPAIVELARGLADGNLFYNFYGRSVMVKGEIIHDGRLGKRATNTYNFTVSPRR